MNQIGFIRITRHTLIHSFSWFSKENLKKTILQCQYSENLQPLYLVSQNKVMKHQNEIWVKLWSNDIQGLGHRPCSIPESDKEWGVPMAINYKNRFYNHPIKTYIVIWSLLLILLEIGLRIINPDIFQFIYNIRKVHSFSSKWKVKLEPNRISHIHLKTHDKNWFLVNECKYSKYKAL